MKIYDLSCVLLRICTYIYIINSFSDTVHTFSLLLADNSRDLIRFEVGSSSGDDRIFSLLLINDRLPIFPLRDRERSSKRIQGNYYSGRILPSIIQIPSWLEYKYIGVTFEKRKKLSQKEEEKTDNTPPPVLPPPRGSIETIADVRPMWCHFDRHVKISNHVRTSGGGRAGGECRWDRQCWKSIFGNQEWLVVMATKLPTSPCIFLSGFISVCVRGRDRRDAYWSTVNGNFVLCLSISALPLVFDSTPEKLFVETRLHDFIM